MSHTNESGHLLSHVSCDCVRLCENKACHTRMSHVINEHDSCHIQIGHVTYKWVMSLAHTGSHVKSCHMVWFLCTLSLAAYALHTRMAICDMTHSCRAILWHVTYIFVYGMTYSAQESDHAPVQVARLICTGLICMGRDSWSRDMSNLYAAWLIVHKNQTMWLDSLTWEGGEM